MFVGFFILVLDLFLDVSDEELENNIIIIIVCVILSKEEIHFL